MEETDPQPDRTDGPRDPTATAGRRLVAAAVEFLTLGLTLAMTLVVCGPSGICVDRWLGTSPMFTLVGRGARYRWPP